MQYAPTVLRKADDLRRAGVPLKQIARIMNLEIRGESLGKQLQRARARGTLAEEHGRGHDNRSLSYADLAVIYELRQEGIQWQFIAQGFGVSERTAKRSLQRVLLHGMNRD